MGQVAGSALATFTEWQRAGAHHRIGMRLVARTSTPLTAAATYTFLLLSLFKLTIAFHPQRYVMCKEMYSYRCLIWPVQIQDEGFDSTESLWTVDKRLMCFIVEFKSYLDDLRFITVKQSDDGENRRVFCKSVSIINPSKLPLPSMKLTNKRLLRLPRSAGFARGRYRGQTQSQYLAIDRGDKKDEGVAEAHSAADSSRATVSGNSGMGQAQSQSMYDPSCDDCLGRSDIDAANLQRGPGEVIPGNTNYGDGPIRGWGNQGNTPVRPGFVTAPGQKPSDVRPPHSLNQNEIAGMHPSTSGFNQYDPRGSSGSKPGDQYGPKGTPEQGEAGLGSGGQYRPDGNDALRPSEHYGHPDTNRPGPGGQYGPNGQGLNVPGSGDISGQVPGRPTVPRPGEEYGPGKVGAQYRSNGMGGQDGQYIPGGQIRGGQYGPIDIAGGKYSPGETTASIPQGQYSPDVTGGRVPSNNYHPAGSMGQRPGTQYGPNGLGGHGPGGQYDPGGMSTRGNSKYGPSGTSGQYSPGGSGTHLPGGQYEPSWYKGQEPNEQYSPNGVGVQGPSGQYDPKGAGWQNPYGPSGIPGSIPGGQYSPDLTGRQGLQSQNGINVGPANTGLGEPTISNGQYIPGGQAGTQWGPNPLQSSFPDKSVTYPVGFKWPSKSGSFVGPDGLNYVCCVVNPNNGAPLPISGSSGQGVSGHFGPGGASGQYGPDGYKGPGIGGYPGVSNNKINGFYGPNAVGDGGVQKPGEQYISGKIGSPNTVGSGGSYGPGLETGGSPGKQYGPENLGLGRPNKPGYESHPGLVTQYGPDMTGNVPSTTQYGPGVTGVFGPGGSYTPGSIGSVNMGEPYVPGTAGGVGLGVHYGPGTTGELGSDGKYTPSVGGGNRPYVPVATGGQYGPGVTNIPGPSAQYGPGTALGPVAGGQYGPTGTRDSGSGLYNSFQTGDPGRNVDGAQSLNSGGTGGQRPSGQYGPIVTGSSDPSGLYSHTATGGIPQEQYSPGTTGNNQGGPYTPGTTGLPVSRGQYAPNTIGGTGSGEKHGLDIGGGQYSVPSTLNSIGSNGQYGPGGSLVGQYTPGISGAGGIYDNGITGNQGALDGQYRPGSTGGPGIAGTYSPGSGGQRPTGVQYGPKDLGPGSSNGGQYIPSDSQYGVGGQGGSETGLPAGQYGPNSAGGQYGPNSAGGQYGPNSAGGQYGPTSSGGQYGPNSSGGQYGPNSAGGHVPSRQYGPGGTIVSRPGDQYGINGPENQMGGDNSQIPPQNVIDPNSMADGDDSQAEASVSQAVNGTVASASSKGGNDKERAQTHVTGTYTGSGSFSAQAAITGENKAANSEVSGDKKGASSTSQGSGRNNKSQANVKLGSETGAVITGSQSEGILHSSNSQVQGSVKGGMADAQARGPGSTSSQAQIGFTPYKEGDKSHDKQKTPFVGGGVASAQSNSRTGMSQSQLHGTFKYGISYNGAAQSGASLDKDAVFPNRLSLEKIDVFDENDKNINVDGINMENTEHTEDITITPEIATSTHVPFDANIEKDLNKGDNINNSEEAYDSHSHADHHTTSEPSLSTTRAPPVESRRSFKSTYSTNNGDYEYSTDKDDNLPEDYDVDDGYGSDGNDQLDGDQGYINPNYNEFSGDSDATHQSLQNARSKGLEVRQTNSGNTQHILLGSLGDQDAEITQRHSEHPDESKVYQPGERVPGTGGYTIPIGFTGSIKSVASKDNTYVLGSDKSPSQAQTVSLTPGNGKVKYKYPSYGRNINPKNLRSLHNPRTEDNNRYVSVSKSVTRDLDSENNIRKQYSHTYYTKSSSCGYFTFTCTMVSSAEGKKRVCKPKIPQSPDGTPIRC